MAACIGGSALKGAARSAIGGEEGSTRGEVARKATGCAEGSTRGDAARDTTACPRGSARGDAARGDTTGLAEGSARLLGALWELSARLRGGTPIVTRRIARDYVGSNVWVTSEKAETELGYRHRSAREALARSVRWFLDNGYVSEQAAGRVRLELRPV